MVQSYSYNGLTWIDVESPSQGEIARLVNEYSLHPSIGEELLSPSSEAKVELHKNCVYINIDIPTRVKNGKHSTVVRKEIDFVVGNHFIITTRYDIIEPLHTFSKVFETNSIVDKKELGEHAGIIFYHIVKALYGSVHRDLRNIRDNISYAETKIFAGEEKDMVVELSHISREMIDMKQVLRTHKETLELVGLAMEKMFSPNFRYHTDELTAEYLKVSEAADNFHELLGELRDTNDSLLTSKQNETMKTLTLMAFITFPLSLITDLFSMNTSHAPIIGHAYDFEIILIVMLAATFFMFIVFKMKKWL